MKVITYYSVTVSNCADGVVFNTDDESLATDMFNKFYSDFLSYVNNNSYNVKEIKVHSNCLAISFGHNQCVSFEISCKRYPINDREEFKIDMERFAKEHKDPTR